jgi:adenylate cyclase
VSIKMFILWCLGLGSLGTYLFVTAPPPLEAEKVQKKKIPIEKALAILNMQNEIVRELYAKEIVGAGKAQGLEFNERWSRSDVDAGPLPALFLRETAFFLEAHPSPLSLFLGSDQPINQANKFTGTQTELFDHIKETRAPESFYSRDTDLYVAMFPDIASSDACTGCHNEHPDSPKKDWRLGDIMGATTWSYPASHVSLEELLEMSEALLNGIEHSYGMVLDELSRLPKKPRIGPYWPRDGYQLPSQDVFMKEVRARTSPRLVQALFEEVRRYDVSQ